jgi:hypothetical protein
MATSKSTSPPRREHAERHHRTLHDQAVVFAGLFLVPFAGLLTAWLIHAYVMGVDLHGGPVDWTVRSGQAAPFVAEGLIVAGSIYLGKVANDFAEHRKDAMRRALVASTTGIGFLFGVNVGTGPHYWWSGIFVLAGWYTAVMWSLARLNVTRQDPREPAEEGKVPEFVDRIKNIGSRGKPKTTYDDAGNPIRTQVKLRATGGETMDAVQEVVPNIESWSGAPGGMTTAVTDPDHADLGELDILHVDPLKGLLPFGPPSHPGGSVEDPVRLATYNNGHPMWCYLGGGPVSISPTGVMFNGTSRSGKTRAEQLMYTELGTRIDWVGIYLNKAKGMQDFRPIAPIFEVAIISDSDADYVSAFDRIKQIMSHRQQVLGEYGISAWSAKRCFHHPPQRKANGDPIPMEPMPFLTVHIGEADAILENYKADDGAVYIASKGLSLGVGSAWSLQKSSHDMMPTALRDNLGARLCFGTMSQSATSMALSDSTVDAGAHPENWGARKPGYLYFEGPGVDESLYPKFGKTDGLAPGMPEAAPIDEHNEAMAAEMLRRNLDSAQRMARLDRGSAEATGSVNGICWWDLMARKTAELRVRLGATASSQTRKPQPQTPESASAGTGPQNQEEMDMAPGFAVTAIPPGGDPDDMEADAEIRDEVRHTRSIEGFDLYPEDEDGDTAEDVDPAAPLTMPPGLAGLRWGGDDRPEAATRNEAIEAVREALVTLLNDPAKRDPDDDWATLIKVEDVTDLVKVKSRSWMSGILADLATGVVDPPLGVTMSRADDLPAGPGRPNFYRLRWERGGD